MGALPLNGITVLSLEQAVAGPFATRQLADLGARVIKVERDSGDFARGYDQSVHGMSSYFVWLNRGKESVVVDLKSPQGARFLSSILPNVDVVVNNLAPGAADRLGLDALTLSTRYPRLISASISGYGRGGPYEQKKAYDLLVQCEAGLVSVTGTPDEPAKVGVSIADIAAGTYTFTGILTALYERERTGKGQALEVSMLEALGEWMAQPYFFAEYGGAPPQRGGAQHPSIAPYGPFPGIDGTVFLGVQNEREWAVLCTEVLRRDDLAADPRFASNALRVAHRGELDAAIRAAFESLPVAELTQRLDAVGIANARLRSVAEFSAHPQLTARDRWRSVDTPVGPVRSLLPPVTVAGREAAMGAVPALGQHTDAIFAELGLGGGI
jgi:itaconate CoA-transferase